MIRKTKTAYSVHKGHAKGRGVPWLFTYDTWRMTWFASGHWDERGRLSGQYVMARLGDKGPYSPDNVHIVEVGANVSEAQTNWTGKRSRKSVENHKRKTSETLTGRKQTETHIKNRMASIKRGKL